MSQRSNTRLRNFVFTINNWNEWDELHLQDIKYQYLIYGKETGTSGTPHLQGYCELINQTRFETIKKIIPNAHIEARKGTQEQAITYCKKDGDISEFGTRKVSGYRSDLDAVRIDALENGMREITSKYNSQQIRVAEKFLTYNEEIRNFKPNVTWIWGKTGTGKSKIAREILHDKDIYTKSDGSKWWDGYDQHEAIIIDDFRDSWWPITEMLSLLDRYEKRIEFKGGWRQLLAKDIIITSAKAPDECYAGTGEAIDQLIRRIDNIINMNVTSQRSGVILGPDLPEEKEDTEKKL